MVLREGTGVTHGGFPPGVVVPGLPEGNVSQFGCAGPMSCSWVIFVTWSLVYDLTHILVPEIILEIS